MSKAKQNISPEMQELIDSAKKAWDELSQDEKDEYVKVATDTTSLRGKKLYQAAFRIFMKDYEELLKLAKYRGGPEGIIRWVEENVRFKVPYSGSDGIKILKWLYVHEFQDDRDKYGRSPVTMWEEHKKIILEAMEMINGQYVNKLIVLNWPRGEGKSFIVILIFLHRFFNYPFQRIYLTSASRTLTDTVHFSEAKEIIENSPKLKEIIGEGGITKEVIRMFKGRRGRFNFIQVLTSATGMVSNATMVAQSEAFLMETDKHFVEWYGSLRATMNAIGLIDSTVSAEDHWLHNLYKKSSEEKSARTYFSYRYSKDGNPKDYWNPGMDQAELDDYRSKFSAYDFARFFLNIWNVDTLRLFSQLDIEAIQYIGVDNVPGNHLQIMECLRKNEKLNKGEARIKDRFKGSDTQHWDRSAEIHKGTVSRLWDIHEVYDFGKHAVPDKNTIRTGSRWATLADLEALGNIFETDFALLAGVDMSDALKAGSRMGARTIVSWMAKGLPGSRGKSRVELNNEDQAYYYFLLGIASVDNHMPHVVSMLIRRIQNEFERIDMLTAETYGMAIQKPVCESLGIPFRTEHPGRDMQNVGFNEFITAVTSGRFKSPIVPIYGSKHSDILREEIGIFDVVSKTGGKMKYGSPEKNKQGGVQDDVIDTIGWGMCGGMNITAAHFRPRKKRVGGFSGKVYDGMYRVGDLFKDLCKWG